MYLLELKSNSLTREEIINFFELFLRFMSQHMPHTCAAHHMSEETNAIVKGLYHNYKEIFLRGQPNTKEAMMRDK